MKKLTSKKSLEFMTIITTVIGTMIGAGIYVKNDEMSGHVLGEMSSPYLALIGWAVIGVICMAAVMIFMEVASSTAEKGNGTVSNWTRLFASRRLASAVSIYFIVIYMPINYAFFADLFINYILTAAGQTPDHLLISKGGLTALYILVGLLFIAAFSYMNSYQRLVGKKTQIVGTIVKFVPLVLVLIGIFVEDQTWAVIFNNTGGLSHQVVKPDGTIVYERAGKGWHTNFSQVTGMQFFSGFAPILFAFNGFIYAANMQKETKNKDMVTKGIFFGVLFTTIFYIIISVALFLSSTDGSVVGFFDWLISGFKTPHVTQYYIQGQSALHDIDPGTLAQGQKHVRAFLKENHYLPYFTHSQAANIVSNVILALVCLMGLNSYSLTGANFINTDANAGILFSNNKFVKTGTSGMIQMGFGMFWLVVLVPVAIYTGHPDNPGYYMDLAGNAGAVIGFLCYDILIILAMVNRYKKKVKVKKINTKLFWVCGIFSCLCFSAILIFSFFQFFTAIRPAFDENFTEQYWWSHIGLPNLLAMVISIGVIAGLWAINEIALKLKPFDKASVEKQEADYLKKIADKNPKLLVEEINDAAIDMEDGSLDLDEVLPKDKLDKIKTKSKHKRE